MKNIHSYLLLTFIIIGCQSPKPIQKGEPPLTPSVTKELVREITIRFASIDISKYTKRIEKSDMQQFAAQMKKDSIDIITIQGITRYPELKTRVDFVNELAAATEMRKTFGETINLSGRQNGNAVFAVYPIRSSENLQFEKLKSTGFEAAMQTIVDCGAKDIVVISTHISDKATKEDIASIMTTLGRLTQTFPDHPIIISGNLESAEASRSMTAYDDISADRNLNTPTVWYSKNDLLKVLEERSMSTVFGKMALINFGIYRRPLP
jgi:endonuclease/exonuclease/phosphatase family metal-dependent hydrolase